MTIDLPYPPSVNHYWKRNRNGGVRVSDEGREYREAVILIANVAGVRSMLDRLEVTIRARMPDRRERDLDNILKATLDALQHAGVYKSDSQIDDLRVVRDRVDKHNPGVQVEISEWEKPE